MLDYSPSFFQVMFVSHDQRLIIIFFLNFQKSFQSISVFSVYSIIIGSRVFKGNSVQIVFAFDRFPETCCQPRETISILPFRLHNWK